MSWRDHAACRGRSDIDWFPLYDASPALAVCATCDVRSDCLRDALAEGYDQNGVRGGYVPAERERMVRQPHRTRPAQCGTDAGYSRHLRVTFTEPCDDCRVAHREANRQRQWRAGTG